MRPGLLRGLAFGLPISLALWLLIGGAAFAQDASLLLTAGNTSQVAVAAVPSGQTVFLYNPSVETETVWVNLGAAAALPVANTSGASVGVTPGGTFSVRTGQSVNVVASDTGHVIVVKKFP